MAEEGPAFGAPRVELTAGTDAKRAEVRCAGALVLAHGQSLWMRLGSLLDEAKGFVRVDVRLSEVEALDGAGAALLVQWRDALVASGVACEWVGASSEAAHLLALYRGPRQELPEPVEVAPSVFVQIGSATMLVLHEVQHALAFLGQLLVELRATLRSPRSTNFREVPRIMERTGADALPIVVLINFLVGLVMAFQASVQLKRFGANILVADLIGISMTRELGPLMSAIIVCGRSGAAFAAELGTMSVNEEIDALRVMSLSPVRYLVFPRILGMFLVLPLLAFFADLVGIVGGLTVGMSWLDVSAEAYVRQTLRAVNLWDIYSGAIKAGVFGLAIGLVACEQGLFATGGAEGVGQRTTTAVVAGLFTLILIDAVFTVMFRLTGL